MQPGKIETHIVDILCLVRKEAEYLSLFKKGSQSASWY